MKKVFIPAALIVLFLTAFFLFNGKQNDMTTSQTAPQEVSGDEESEGLPSAMDEDTVQTGYLVGNDSIYVADQAPSNTLIISAVKLQKPGYVVIHRVDENESPGNIIGTSPLLSQSDVDTTVSLNEAVNDGEFLIAMLHTDDGDAQFVFPGPDAPILDGEGNTIMMKFRLSADSVPQEDVSL